MSIATQERARIVTRGVTPKVSMRWPWPDGSTPRPQR